jgi:hypothetical protein
MTKLTHEAAIPNPALSPFGVLVGRWRTIGSHPMLPGPLNGITEFDWIEGGAFLRMLSSIDEPGVPSGVAIFGSDDATGEFFMVYFDERGVSRKYEMSLRDNVWRWWRNVPNFSQRYVATIAEDGNSIIGKGELSRDNVTWEPDLNLTYTRIPSP